MTERGSSIRSLLALDGDSDGEFTVLVPLSNPESETHLVTLGAAIANQRNGRVVAVSIVQVPDQTPLDVARDEFDYQQSTTLLESARHDAWELGVPIETHTVFSHTLFRQLFDTARRYDADVCVMGWGPDSPGIGGRAESVVKELAHSLPCDFVLFKDRGFDPERILLPTTGGPHTEMAAILARIMRAEFESEITLLHVADDPTEGREFLESWATDHGLADATLRVETGDVEAAIEAAARDHTMILIGATQRGVLFRLVRGSLVLGVLETVDCSVVITERETNRGFIRTLLDR